MIKFVKVYKDSSWLVQILVCVVHTFTSLHWAGGVFGCPNGLSWNYFHFVKLTVSKICQKVSNLPNSILYLIDYAKKMNSSNLVESDYDR